MVNPRVALIVDHPQRDLAGLVLTAFELCQHGVTCHLVPHNVEEREIWALSPDFVLLNFFRKGNDHLARRMVMAGIQFGLLDTEGGVWPDPESYAELLWSDVQLLRKARLVCMWGPTMAEYTVRKEVFAADQVVVTGCPRFDLYYQRWSPLLSPKRVDAGDGKRHRILINTNYYTANSRFVSTELNAKQFREVFGWSQERTEQLIESEQRAIVGMIAIARQLTSDYPGSEIVLRPHPFEKPETYRSQLLGVKNLEINCDGPVQPQIHIATAVIQRSCTTALEAAMAGVPALSPQWIPAPSVNPMSEAVSIPCDSYADMRSHIDAILARQYQTSSEITQSVKCEISKWFYQIDGNSHKRVADAILSTVRTRPIVDDKLCARYLYGIHEMSEDSGSGFSGRLRHTLGLSPDWSFRKMRNIPTWPKPEKRFDINDVEVLTTRIEQIRRSNDPPVRPVVASYARVRGDYSHRYFGHSITVAPV